VGINRTNGPAVAMYYFIICSGHLCLRRERGRPVELSNACSVDIGGGRSQEGDRAGGTPASSQMYSFYYIYLPPSFDGGGLDIIYYLVSGSRGIVWGRTTCF
jgi:hypothetical protein